MACSRCDNDCIQSGDPEPSKGNRRSRGRVGKSQCKLVTRIPRFFGMQVSCMGLEFGGDVKVVCESDTQMWPA